MTTRTSMRALILALIAGGGTFVAWQGASALQSTEEAKEEKADKPKPAAEAAPKPVEPKTAATPAPRPAMPSPAAPRALAPTGKATPMEQRVAKVGLLNKRNGLWRDLTLKPGESIRIGDVVVRLRACETSAPWEHEHLTGAFVQVIVRSPDDKWKRVFSGWLFKETPSLNAVEHPVYDVWTKDCQMRHPDIGPDTITARGGEIGASSEEKSESRRSRARSSTDE
jgi:hypothetical protein